MPKTKNAMRRWLDTATAEQALKLAALTKTSLPHLRHIAAGRRTISASFAQRLAAASRRMKAPYLDPRETCQVCGACPLAKAK